jgi:hypothetical protein
VSVDTYLKRKNLAPYQVAEHDGVTIYVANALLQWAREVRLGAKQFLIWKSFDIEAEHNHTMACAH